MSSSGENNSSLPEHSISWKAAKAGLYTTIAEDNVVLEDNINLQYTNLLGADAPGTVIGTDADLADIQPDKPPSNIQHQIIINMESVGAPGVNAHLVQANYI